MDTSVPRGRLSGVATPPCSKSYAQRALAAALLAEMARRMGEKGATLLTGGGDVFYQKIGFQPIHTWTFWER